MLRTYDKLSATERRTIKNWHMGVTGIYLTLIAAFIGLMAINQAVGEWMTEAYQLEIAGSGIAPAVDPVPTTQTAKR
jgi:hypothetical protein